MTLGYPTSDMVLGWKVKLRVRVRFTSNTAWVWTLWVPSSFMLYAVILDVLLCEHQSLRSTQDDGTVSTVDASISLAAIFLIWAFKWQNALYWIKSFFCNNTYIIFIYNNNNNNNNNVGWSPVALDFATLSISQFFSSLQGSIILI